MISDHMQSCQCTVYIGSGETPIYDFHAPKTHCYGCMAAMYICNYTYAQSPLPTLVIIALTLVVVLQYLLTFLQVSLNKLCYCYCKVHNDFSEECQEEQ